MHIVNLDNERKEIDTANHDALKLIKSVIAEINSGEIVSLGVSWVTKDGSIGGDVSRGNNNISMWASLEHSARSFYEDIIKG